MRTVTVVYHLEDESWWVETDEYPGFVAGGSTFEDARRLAGEGLEFETGHTVELDERFDEPARAARRQQSQVWSGTSVLSQSARSWSPTTGLDIAPLRRPARVDDSRPAHMASSGA